MLSTAMYSGSLESAAAELVERYPVACLTVRSTGIDLDPYHGGFSISLTRHADRLEHWALSLGPWYDELVSASVALALIEQSLSGAVRIRLEKLNGKPLAYTVELKHAGRGWIEIAQNRYFRFALFRMEHTVEYQRFPAVRSEAARLRMH